MHQQFDFMCSVPPKAEAEPKDGAGSKADDDKEEKSKPWKAGNPLQDAVRDAKVPSTMAYTAQMPDKSVLLCLGGVIFDTANPCEYATAPKVSSALNEAGWLRR